MNKMELILNILMLSFIALGTVAIIASVVFMLVTSRMNTILSLKDETNDSDTYNRLLYQLNNGGCPEQRGEAFVKMVERGDIQLHILKNQGNCYNDALQPEIYQKFLSSQCVNALFELEGKNAGY